MRLITSLSLRGRIATVAIMLAVVLGGIFSLNRMQIELLPDIDFPLITISASYPQANSETVLQDISIPLENATDGIIGLESMRSISSPGFSLVLTEFEFGTNMENAAIAVAENLDSIVLPPGASDPKLLRINLDELPILQFSVLQEGDLSELSELVGTRILPDLRKVPGVFSADMPPGSDTGLSITRTNSKPSMSVEVVKQPDANTVAVIDGVLESLENLKPGLPSDIEFVTVLNQAPEVRATVEGLQREATLGALFAVAVIFVFLLSGRATLVTSISIPTSILGGIIFMDWQGMSLNMMTMGGLAVAVGRVVDDSIVVLENCYRHMREGGDRIRATLEATIEVSGAITTSTLTTIAVFLPLGFIGGITGTFFLPFALTVTFALLASLLVSLTVVPVLASLLIRTTDDTTEKETWLQRAYKPAIQWALGHKLITVLISVALFIGSLGLLPLIPVTFLPQSGGDLLTIKLTMPPGTNHESTFKEVMTIEDSLNDLKETGIATVYQSTVGGLNPMDPTSGGTGPNRANFYLALTEEVDGSVIADQLRARFSGYGPSLIVAEAQSGGPPTNELELVLTGDDYEAAVTTSTQILTALENVSGLINVSSDASVRMGDKGNFTSIKRLNKRRAVTISGSITDENTQRVKQDVDAQIALIDMPSGVKLETGGVFSDIREVFTQMAIAMIIGIGLVYIVMIISMRSLITPFVVVLSLPLASIGALGALFITQRTLGLPSLIGMLMLIGLVVTNAIVLLTFVDQLRAKGASIYEALVHGGLVRLRPILMTAFTTSFGLLPLAVIVSDGGIISAELATIVIGGLMTSTFLTLLVIPVAYSLLRREKPSAVQIAPNKYP